MRQRKPTRAELEAKLQYLNLAVTRLDRALQDHVNGKVIHVLTHRDGHDRYVFSVSRLDAPDGGLFIETFYSRLAGQSPYTTAHSLESQIRYFESNRGTEFGSVMSAQREAVGKAAQMREEAYRISA